MSIEINSIKNKYSKWSIVAFIYFILNVIGLPFVTITYASVYAYVIDILGMIIELGVLWYIVRYIKRSDLKGYKLATISLYGVLIINIIVFSIMTFLMSSSKEVENFALEKTKIITQEDLSALRAISTQAMIDSIAYENDLSDFRKVIIAAGEINECRFIETSYTNVSAGFYTVYKSKKWGIQSEYGIRCLGTTGFIDFVVGLRNQDNQWKINAIVYTSSNPELQKQSETEQE